MLISGRANTILLVAILAVGIGIVAMLASGVRAGPLDPPSAPAPTDGVRQAGTPISSVPFAITTAGRYYLTRDLSYSGGANAITITADNVVLDLGGFTLDGLGTAAAGVYDLSQAHSNVSVEHGVLRGFGSGIFLQSITGGKISDVQVVGSSQASGWGIYSPQKGLIEDCDITNVHIGIELQAQGVMRRCHVHDIGQYGASVHDYTVIEDSIIELAASAGVSSSGSFITIRNNRFSKNGSGLTDVSAGSGVAAVIDNVINCETSLKVTTGGQLVTTGPAGSHPNIPVFAAGFC